MNAEDVRRILGDVSGWEEWDYAAVAESASADSHEGAECLPRYKLALSLLAQSCGLLDATLGKLLVGLGPDTPAGRTVAANLESARELWAKHLLAIPPG